MRPDTGRWAPPAAAPVREFPGAPPLRTPPPLVAERPRRARRRRGGTRASAPVSAVSWSSRRADGEGVSEHGSVIGGVRLRDIAVGEGCSKELGPLAQLVRDGARAEQEFAVRRTRVDEDAALIGAELDREHQRALNALPGRESGRVPA